MTEVIQVFTTVDTRETAEIIARGLVEQRLAACVQVLGPLRSTYRWEGAIESAEEWLCLIKTTGAAYEALEKEIRAHHPYDVPEILAVPVAAGHSAYLAWLGAQIDR
jgi:periplasmic divalent cation tolerance protein